MFIGSIELLSVVNLQEEWRERRTILILWETEAANNHN